MFQQQGYIQAYIYTHNWVCLLKQSSANHSVAAYNGSIVTPSTLLVTTSTESSNVTDCVTEDEGPESYLSVGLLMAGIVTARFGELHVCSFPKPCKMETVRLRSRVKLQTVSVLLLCVGWLFNVPATCQCFSLMDLLRLFYMLPH